MPRLTTAVCALWEAQGADKRHSTSKPSVPQNMLLTAIQAPSCGAAIDRPRERVDVQGSCKSTENHCPQDQRERVRILQAEDTKT
mmetsp:Transcript_12918/g.24040  ORF Transcript_12918/g.24040 Transcript_12918/m.24040 type:complete len:85 (+) Transcript_12918:431-685(+)